MREFERQQWQRTRQQGAWVYVLWRGVLCFGVPMFLFVQFVLNRKRLPMWESAALWVLTGIIYGAFQWVSTERRYRKALAERPN